MKYGFGVDVGGTTVKIAYFDQEGSMHSKWEIPTVTDRDGEQILSDIAQSVLSYIREHDIPKKDLIGIGIGVPGPVDEDGVVNKCINLGWGRKNIHQELGALTGLGVKAGNDANVAALGECWQGSGKGSKNMVMATLGTGIGGGIVAGGHLLTGAHGAAGEIGHIVLEENEPEQCGCGNRGCVEQYGSATGVVRLAHRYFHAHPDSDSPLLQCAPMTCKDIFDQAKAKDPAALAIVDRVCDYLGRFIGAVCAVVDPEVVVLGGGVSKAGEILIEGVKPYFEKYSFHACRDTEITLAVLGNDAGAYGAFKLALDEFAIT